MHPLADIPWLVWLVVVPLAAGAAALLLRGASGPVLGAILAPAMLSGAGLLAWQVWHQGPQRYSLAGWGAPLGIDLLVDGLAAVMLLMTAAVAAAISLNSLDYFADPHPGAAHDDPVHEEPAAGSERVPHDDRASQRRYFWPLWLLLIGSLNALFISSDVFNLYVTLELVTLSSVALAALANSYEALEAALRYLLVALFGSLAYLLGVALLYAAYGTLDVTLLGERIAAAPGPMAVTAAGAMAVGLAAKAALFPMHFWLPPAHANAPAPVSAALSALVVTAAYYVLARLWFGIFPPVAAPSAGLLLGGLGAAAIFWGSIQALLTHRLKLLVAYSTVAQLGYLFLVFAMAPSAGGAEAWSGAILFAVSHACAKGALFLAAGKVAHIAGHDRLAELSEVAWRTPTSYMTMGLAGVALLGLPPSGSYTGKWLLLEGALAHQAWISFVALAGSLLAGAYMLRVVSSAFNLTVKAKPLSPTVHTEWLTAADLPPLTLALLAVLLGFLADPLLHLLRIGAPTLVVLPREVGL